MSGHSAEQTGVFVPLASRTVTGAVALLLLLAVFGGRAWAIIGGEVDQNNAYANVGGNSRGRGQRIRYK